MLDVVSEQLYATKQNDVQTTLRKHSADHNVKYKT